MNQLSNIKTAYFLGIGGIGMSAIARYFAQKGIQVSGYDKTPSAVTKALEEEGIQIIFEDKIELLPATIDVVIYTPAIPKNHTQYNYFLEEKTWMIKRAQALGLITEEAFTIAVAGSHGKTTVSTMVAHILKDSGYDCSAFLGGISRNYNTNYIQGNNDVVVVEADEFDRSFHTLNPDLAIITAVDTDHLDIYGTKENIEKAFIEFTEKIEPEGIVYTKPSVSIISDIKRKIETYNVDAPADLCVTSLKSEQGVSVFTTNKTTSEFRLQVGGKHNVENALAAISVALHLKISEEKIAKAISNFTGIKRRFEKYIENENNVFIDDYAHHPEEINALLNGVRGLYPNRKITVVFQPHLYSRTKDLATEFGDALSKADNVLLLEIYPARELAIPGVTSKLIFDNISIQNKKQITKSVLVEEIKNTDIDILLTVGAGDIDKYLEEIKNVLA